MPHCCCCEGDCEGDEECDGYENDDYSEEPVRYSNGAIKWSEQDLSFTTFGRPWGHLRSYGNYPRVDHYTPRNGINGTNWTISQVPRLLLHETVNGAPGAVVEISPTRSLYFYRTSSSPERYRALYFQKSSLQYRSSDKEYALIDSRGQQTLFDRNGRFKGLMNASGQRVLATYDGGALASLLVGEGENAVGLTYSYQGHGSARRLVEVHLRLLGVNSRRCRYPTMAWRKVAGYLAI